MDSMSSSLSSTGKMMGGRLHSRSRGRSRSRSASGGRRTRRHRMRAGKRHLTHRRR